MMNHWNTHKMPVKVWLVPASCRERSAQFCDSETQLHSWNSILLWVSILRSTIKKLIIEKCSVINAGRRKTNQQNQTKINLSDVHFMYLFGKGPRTNTLMYDELCSKATTGMHNGTDNSLMMLPYCSSENFDSIKISEISNFLLKNRKYEFSYSKMYTVQSYLFVLVSQVFLI